MAEQRSTHRAGGTMMRWLVIGLRILVAAVFLYAGSQKVFAVAEFAAAINRYQILPLWGGALVASVLPTLEIIVAVALLLPGWWRSGALVSIALNGVFCAALLSALLRDLPIDCGCFGDSAGLWSSLGAAQLRASGLLGISLYLFLSEEREQP